MNLLILSDLHGCFSLPNEQPDVVFLLGDNTPWDIRHIIKQYNCPIFGVLGNHDFPNDYEELPITNVHGTVTSWNGFTIAGWGGCPSVDSKRMHYSEKETSTFLSTLPQVDFFLSHSNPASFTIHSLPSHQGFHAFDHYMKETSPIHWFHGHLHYSATYTLHDTIVHSVYPSLFLSL